MKTRNVLLTLTLLITLPFFGQNNLLQTTGSVGIGTTTPSATLEVAGTAKISSWSPILTLQRDTNTGGYIQGIQTKKLDGTDNWFFGNVGLGTNPWVVSKGDFQDPKLTVFDNGDIGIGTTTPFSKLTIVGSFALGSSLSNLSARPSITGGTSSTGEIRAFDSSNNLMDNGFVRVSAGGGTNGSVKSYIDLSGYSVIPDMDRNIVFGTSGNERLRILANGKVGIGTLNPDEMLTVNGTIHATEVKVTASVTPDYVFQKYYTGKSELKSDYVMPTLAEIEIFTKENNHLPNVPSAKEIQEKGMSLGEMSNVLLQKVEELTLYAIEQNKRILTQQEELEQLKIEKENYKSLTERLSAIEKELKK